MRIRTIAAALVVAAPLLALGSPQAAACWDTGYGYTATSRHTRSTSSLRLHELRLLFACYYGGRWLLWRLRRLGRVAVRRAIYRGGGYYGGVRRVGYRGGVGVRRGLGVGVGRVGRFR